MLASAHGGVRLPRICLPSQRPDNWGRSRLGLVNPHHPASPNDSEGFVDILLSQPLNSGPTHIGDNFYTRTGNDPLGGVYPAADFALEPSDITSGTVDLGSGYFYLLAKDDGKNYGSEVWYVGGLIGIQDIPLVGGGIWPVAYLRSSTPTPPRFQMVAPPPSCSARL